MIKPNTAVFTLTISVLAVTHYLSLQFSLYWLYPWLDNITHLMGGSAVMLGWFSLRDFLPKLPASLFRIWPALFVVLVVALVWELFEFKIGATTEVGYWVDTVSDVVIGLCGGLVGYLVAKRLHDHL